MMDLSVQVPDGHRVKVWTEGGVVSLTLDSCGPPAIYKKGECDDLPGESVQEECPYCGKIAAVTVADR